MSYFIKFARQWIAGETLDDAVKSAQKARNSNVGAIINFLGEHVRDAGEAQRNLEENLKILDTIAQSRVQASLSIKLTQLGLDMEKDLCLSNVEEIVKKASSENIFVWIDMEDAHYTEETIDIYLEVLKRYENVGIAIQANLRRSETDVQRIVAQGGTIRLVKGAYQEKKEIAYTNREEVAINFTKLMGYLFYKSSFFAVATHDDALIDEAIEANRAHKKKIEFQMLMGVRERLKKKLARQGFVLVDYIPYGAHWFPYSVRRIRERKRNILLIVRSLFDI